MVRLVHVELGRFVVPRLELARGHRRRLPLRVRRMADLRAAAHTLARVRPVAAPSDGRRLRWGPTFLGLTHLGVGRR